MRITFASGVISMAGRNSQRIQEINIKSISTSGKITWNIERRSEGDFRSGNEIC